MKNIAQSLADVRRRIAGTAGKCGRNPDDIRLLAVSKTRPVEAILAALENGQTDFGENYVQEGFSKINQIRNPALIWHFIGPLQSNKTRVVAENFQWVHSIDRSKIAKRLNDHRPDHLPLLNICIQINISREISKAGVKNQELLHLINDCMELPRLRLRGLMCLPAPVDDFELQRKPFRQLRELLDDCKKLCPNLDTLSMGTTADMEAAIAEGATIIRVGSAIFGFRDT